MNKDNNSLFDLIKNRPVVCDGAMGTMLYSKGIYLNKCFDELNLTNPSLIGEVHSAYAKAGAEIIETNTFGANRFRLLSFGLEQDVKKINLEGVRIARENSSQAMVGGAVGPINAHLKPIGGVSRDELLSIYTEQIGALIEGGVDLLVLETFPGVEMLRYAIEAARKITDMPIIAQVTLNDYGNTLHDETPQKVIEKLGEYEKVILGANCSVGPSVMLDSLISMRSASSSIYLAAQPNAGLPKMVDGRFIYLCSPEYMAEYAKRFIQNGVSIVGGCCGTTPDHIKAIAAAVKALSPLKEESKKKEIKVSESRESKKEVPDVSKSPFAKKILSGKFVKSVEIDPPRGINYDDAVLWAGKLQEAGFDAVNIADGPRATARMSPLALANIIQRKAKMDVILHVCCRDRNMLGMQSDLLGASAMGIKNILAVTGDPPKLGDYPDATAVFDVDSIGLLKIASNLNVGLDVAGNSIGDQTTFFLGVGLNPGAIDLKEELRRFELKIASGAKYAMTQPVFDIDLLVNVMKKIEQYNIPVIAGILPLHSLRNAEFLNNEVPGMSVPDEIMARMRKNPSGKKAREEGIKIAKEAMNNCEELVSGIYIMPPFGKYEMAMSVVAND